MLSTLRAVALVVLALVLTLAVGGCGGGDNGEPRAGKQGAAAAEQPLAGKGVSRAADLVGVWMRVTEGELLGLEFLKNDQVILTVRRGQPSSMTMSYTLLDGGRLSVVSGGGATTVYRTTRSKDLLELVAESAGPEAKPQRFRKLEAGQTLGDGLRAQAAALEAERAERTRGVVGVLKREGLIIGPGAGDDGGWLMALRVDHGLPEGGGMFQGLLTLDPSPGRADVLRPVTVHQFRGSLGAADELSSRLRLTIEVVQAHEPGTENDVNGRADLIVDGPIGAPEISGTVRMAKRWPGARDAVLTADKERHAGAVAALEAQRRAMLAALAEVTDALGGRAVLRGQRTVVAGAASELVEVTIERGAAELTYNATVTVGTRRDQRAQGAVGLVLGRGALYINTPWGEQWRLQVERNGTLDGLWRPSTRHDFVGHGSVTLAVERVWTMEQVEAERAAIAKFLNEDLRTARRFTGTVEVGQGDDMEPWPLTLDLRIGDNGAAEGEIWSLSHRGGGKVTGTLGAGTITLKATGYADGSRQDRSLLQQTLNLRLTGMDPRPTLQGDVRIGTRGGPAVLRLADPEPGTAESDALLAALRGRATRATNLNISRRPEPTYILFDAALDGSSVTGTIVGHDILGRRPSPLPPGLVRVSASQERGHPVLKVVIDSSPDPVQGKDGDRYEYTAIVREGDEGPTVFAWDAPVMGDETWLRLDPLPSGEMPAVSDEQRLRIAAQRMGVTTKVPASPAVGDSVLLIMKPTDRDRRLGQIFYADRRYCAGNSVAAAALHAGVLAVDEVGVVRLTYREPFTEPVTVDERNGVTSQKRAFKAGNTIPTFTVERVNVGE